MNNRKAGKKIEKWVFILIRIESVLGSNAYVIELRNENFFEENFDSVTYCEIATLCSTKKPLQPKFRRKNRSLHMTSKLHVNSPPSQIVRLNKSCMRCHRDLFRAFSHSPGLLCGECDGAICQNCLLDYSSLYVMANSEMATVCFSPSCNAQWKCLHPDTELGVVILISTKSVGDNIKGSEE